MSSKIWEHDDMDYKLLLFLTRIFKHITRMSSKIREHYDINYMMFSLKNKIIHYLITCHILVWFE